jgi:hypothetical protein
MAQKLTLSHSHSTAHYGRTHTQTHTDTHAHTHRHTHTHTDTHTHTHTHTHTQHTVHILTIQPRCVRSHILHNGHEPAAIRLLFALVRKHHIDAELLCRVQFANSKDGCQYGSLVVGRATAVEKLVATCELERAGQPFALGW